MHKRDKEKTMNNRNAVVSAFLALAVCVTHAQIKPGGSIYRAFEQDYQEYMQGMYCPSDSAERMVLMENTVLKNIYMYRIAMIRDSFTAEYGYYSTDNLLDSVLPDYDYKLKFDIQRYDYYGNNSYTYSFYKEKDIFTNGENAYESMFYKGMFPYDNYFLVAFDSLTCEVKFLSGNFFLSVLPSDELFLQDTINELQCLLRYRLFQYQVRDLAYSKYEHEMYTFVGYSEVLNKPLLIYIEPYDKSVNNDDQYPDKISFRYYTEESGVFYEVTKRIIRAPRNLEATREEKRIVQRNCIPSDML